MGNNISLASNHLNNTNNTVGLLLNSDSVANAVQGIIKNLNESTAKLNEDQEALQHNFL